MILVTGGAGFIGSVLVHYLNSIGITNIIVVDRWGVDGKWPNLLGAKFDQFIHADDLFTEQKNILSGVKVIYHLGACSDTSERDMDFLWKNNCLYSQRLFTIAAQNEIKFLYASSAATYGGGERGYVDDHQGIGQLRPLNPYGYSKQLFDEWVLKQKRFPPRWFGVKFFNVYGPNEYHKGRMMSVVYQNYHQAKEKGQVRLFKSYREGIAHGEQLRDFIYVKDAVKAMVDLMENSSTHAPAASSGIYNLGTGKARSFNDLAGAVLASMNLKNSIEYIEMPSDLREQYQYYTQAEMDKFRKVLPNFPFHTLEEGVKDYVMNYLMKDRPFMA